MERFTLIKVTVDAKELDSFLKSLKSIEDPTSNQLAKNTQAKAKQNVSHVEWKGTLRD